MVQSARADGRDVELLSPREARAIEPFASPDLPGYVYTRQRGNANPARATRAFADAARTGRRERFDRPRGHGHRRPCRRLVRRVHAAGRGPRGRAGARCRSVVWACGRDAGVEHPRRARARPDVGHRAAAAPRVPGHILHGVAALLERARRGYHASRSDPPRRRETDQAPVRAADPVGGDSVRRRQAARGLRHHARRARA